MRVRKVVTRSGKRFRGKFPSTKMGRMVHWESLLERDAILHLEYHPLIVRYQEQPSIETYYDAMGCTHKYVPDFLVVLSDGTEFNLEIKPSNKLIKPEIRHKLGSVALRLEEQKRGFRIWTEEVIRREPLFSNLKTLHRSTKTALEREVREQFKRVKHSITDSSFQEAVCKIGHERDLLSLLRFGYLHADLEGTLIEESRIWIPGIMGKSHDTFRI